VQRAKAARTFLTAHASSKTDEVRAGLTSLLRKRHAKPHMCFTSASVVLHAQLQRQAKSLQVIRFIEGVSVTSIREPTTHDCDHSASILQDSMNEDPIDRELN
jgi:hypothetical protein